MTRSRSGFALSATLMVLAVAAVAALGILRAGLQRALDARDAARLVQAEAAAESAVRTALVHWDADSMRAVPAGTRRRVGGPATFAGVLEAVFAERIGATQYVVSGEAAEGPPGGTVRARATALAIVHMIPRDPIWLDFPAALTSAGSVDLAGGAVLTGLDVGVPSAWAASDCPAGLAALVAALFGVADRPGIGIPAAGATVSAAGATLAGAPPVLAGAPRTDTAGFGRLGSLALPDVASLADRVETGSVGLAPVAVGGVCDPLAAGNWGAPGDPAHPCFDFVPLVFAPGDLEIAAGAGQAILVVNGDLRIRSGVRLTGLLLARGRLEMDDATVTGAVRARNGASVAGSIAYSACAIGRIVDRTRALRRPVRAGDRFWLPAF